MLKYMLCGVVVMTASCFSMEQPPEKPKYERIIGCNYCINQFCQGPLPGSAACTQAAMNHAWPQHDGTRNASFRGCWKRWSSSGF